MDEGGYQPAGDAPPLTFGIYPGGATGTDAGPDGAGHPTESGIAAGPPDDPERIHDALRTLQGGEDRPFVVRGYVPFHDPSAPLPATLRTPENVERYARDGRRLDLVAMFHSASGDVGGFVSFVREQVRRYGSLADTVQVTEEANVSNIPVLDGAYPNVREALVRGVVAVKDEARSKGHDHLKVGFNAAPSFGSGAGFWREIGELGGRSFVEALGYVGLDFFPGVFGPAAPDGEPGHLRQMVAGVLRAMREEWMPAAGIPDSVPIHVAENGWPTGPDRSYERQAEALETVVRAVHEHRGRYNVARYELFDLRDADSSNPDPFYQFGILRDDYAPKPAFEVYRRLVSELGGVDALRDPKEA